MKKQKLPKLRKGAWFIKVRGSYLPYTLKGYLTYIPFVAFLIVVLVHVIHTEDTLSGALYMIFPEWVAAAVVMTWLASRKS